MVTTASITYSMPAQDREPPGQRSGLHSGMAQPKPREQGCPNRIEVEMPRHLFDLLTVNNKAPRCRYETERGVAEFVAAPALVHDSQTHSITRLFNHIEVALADAGRFPTHHVAGSTRLVSRDGAFEPDTSIFVDPKRATRAWELGRGPNAQDTYLEVEKGHPIPDLVAEVDRSSDSSHKLVPYFRMGVREAWTWNARGGAIIWIAGDETPEQPVHAQRSRVFPGLDREDLDRLLAVGLGKQERFRLSRELAGQVVAELLGAGRAE